MSRCTVLLIALGRVCVVGRNFSALLQWLEADLHVRVHANVTIDYTSALGPTGLALSASAIPLRPRDTIISGYPLAAYLTADVAVRHAPELGGVLRGAAGECLTLAMFVARERLRLWRWRQHGPLPHGSISTARLPRFWDPYIESLPSQIPYGRHALGFGATLKLLRRSPSAAAWLADDAAAQQEIDEFTERSDVASMLRSWWAVDAIDDVNVSQGRNRNLALLQAKAAVRWAQRIVESRALPPPSWPQPATSCALAPLLDLMNHRTGAPRLVSRRLNLSSAQCSDQQQDQQPDQQQQWDMLSGTTIMPGEQILDDYDATAGVSGPGRMCNLALLMQHGFVEPGRKERFAYYHRWECDAGTDGFEGDESTRSNSSEQFDLQHLRREALARADLPSTALLTLRVQTQSGPHGQPSRNGTEEARLRGLFGVTLLRAMRICVLRADELRRALRGESVFLDTKRDKYWRCAMYAQLSRARERLQALLRAAEGHDSKLWFNGEQEMTANADQQPPWLPTPVCRERSKGDIGAAMAIFAGELRVLEFVLSTLSCAAPKSPI